MNGDERRLSMSRLLLASLSTLALVACGDNGGSGNSAAAANTPAPAAETLGAATPATPAEAEATPEPAAGQTAQAEEGSSQEHESASREQEREREHESDEHEENHFDLAAVPGSLDLTGADLANGRREFRRCQSCHTINDGGRAMVGPNLYGVVGRAAASTDGFSYSSALAESGLVWTSDALDTWIENPRAMVPNNRMSFVGLRDADDRRDVIAYLASLTASDD
jgi:cytochrome c